MFCLFCYGDFRQVKLTFSFSVGRGRSVKKIIFLDLASICLSQFRVGLEECCFFIILYVTYNKKVLTLFLKHTKFILYIKDIKEVVSESLVEILNEWIRFTW